MWLGGGPRAFWEKDERERRHRATKLGGGWSQPASPQRVQFAEGGPVDGQSHRYKGYLTRSSA